MYQSSLGSRKKINPPTCLPLTSKCQGLVCQGLTFCPFFGVAQKVTYARGSAKLCRPFTRLEVAPYFKATPKFSAFWGIYFLPQPLSHHNTAHLRVREKITLQFMALSFRSDLVELIELNRKHSLSYVEDSANEDRTKMA